jgi:hypothetical protein
MIRNNERLITTQPFVEFFLPEEEWRVLLPKLEQNPEVTWFAGNASGQFEACHADAVNPVTWGTFAGKEYELLIPSHTCNEHKLTWQ